LLGQTGGASIAVAGQGDVAVAALKRAHESWFPTFMGADELPPTN
jgi:phosphoribosylformylglycinamidine synthase